MLLSKLVNPLLSASRASSTRGVSSIYFQSAIRSKIAPLALQSRAFATTEPNKPESVKESAVKEEVQTTQNEKEQRQQEEQTKQQTKKKTNTILNGLTVGFIFVCGAGVVAWGIHKLSLGGAVYNRFYEKTQDSVVTFIDNLKNNVYHMTGVSRDPIPFLPPPLPEGYGRKYTLIVDMDSLADCKYEKGGWRLHKRAGLDYFLTSVFKYYEVVLYSNEYQGANQQAIWKIDPTGQIFSHHKFKESGMKSSTPIQFTNDIALLQRDPSKVLFLDSSTLSYSHPNVVCIGRTDPKKPDTVLIDLAKVLNNIAASNVDDVRPLVSDLSTKETQKRLQELGKPGPALGKIFAQPPQQK